MVAAPGPPTARKLGKDAFTRKNLEEALGWNRRTVIKYVEAAVKADSPCAATIPGLLMKSTPGTNGASRREDLVVSTDTGRGKNASSLTVRGLFLAVHLDKDFAGSTVLIPSSVSYISALFGEGLIGKAVKGALDSAQPAQGRFDRDRFIKAGQAEYVLAPVDLGDSEFHEHFRAFSTEPELAAKTFPKSLRDSLVRFQKKTGRGVKVALCGSIVSVFIPAAANLFEPSASESLVNMEAVAGHIEELEFALSVVDDLAPGAPSQSRGTLPETGGDSK